MTKAELTSKLPSNKGGMSRNSAVRRGDKKHAVKECFENNSPPAESKELYCLNEIGRLTDLYGVFAPSLFHKLVYLIPSAFQFPDITCSRITINHKEFQTDNFRESRWKLHQEICVEGEPVGMVEVYYLQQRPLACNGPFLEKETNFLQALAGQLGIILLCRQLEAVRKETKWQIQEMKFNAIKKLSRGIAHNFNNLLTVINGYSKYILDTMAKSHSAYADIAEINKAGTMGADLIRRLVTFSGQTKTGLRKLDVNSTILEARRLIHSMVGDDIELIICPCDHSAIIEADPGQFAHILLNVIENAREALPEGGTIKVQSFCVIFDTFFCLGKDAYQPGLYAALEISDSGTGMSSEIREQALDPLCTTKKKRMGVGLGLASANRVVKQSNGLITIHSKRNIGTQVTVYFPIVEEIPNLTNTAGAVSSGRDDGGETVLIVHNDVTAREMIARILAHHGYATRGVASAREVMRVCRPKAIGADLMLLNDVLPDMSGWWLHRKLREAKFDLPILIMTDQWGSKASGKLDDTMGVLTKPVNVSYLLKSVHEVLNNGGDYASPPVSVESQVFEDGTVREKLVMILSNHMGLVHELREGLKCFNRSAICREDTADALAELEELDDLFDCVIIDPRLDGSTHPEFLHHIRELYTEIRIAIVTNADPDSVTELSRNVFQLSLPLTRRGLKTMLAASN